MTTQLERGVSMRVKQVRRHFDKFLQKSIHRFLIPKKWTYLEIAKKIFSIIFWGMMYLMGSYLTFILLLQTMKEYQSHPANLQMESIMNDKIGMIVPDYTLCIQGPISWNCQALRIEQLSLNSALSSLHYHMWNWYFGDNMRNWDSILQF